MPSLPWAHCGLPCLVGLHALVLWAPPLAAAYTPAVIAGGTGLSEGDHSRGEAIVGRVRVQALSPLLVRVEPLGPAGFFEDRPTYNVVGRNAFRGVPITGVQSSLVGHFVTTAHYSVLLTSGAEPIPTCSAPLMGDIEATGVLQGWVGPRVDMEGCCQACEEDEGCRIWLYDNTTARCRKYTAFESIVPSDTKSVGCSSRGCASFTSPAFKILDRDGSVLHEQGALGAGLARANLLHFPAPLQAPAYTLVDHPRFFVPEWGPTPVPSGVRLTQELVATNGYDFRNNVDGDTYVFLLGGSLGTWSAARADLLRLIGPCPLLPDFAFGTWYTWWHNFTEAEARDQIDRWESERLPLDVWALDMNWRETIDGRDRFYDNPNRTRFANFTQWFQYLKAKRLHTYFNDHPYPVAARGAGGLQTSPEEVAFRWEGLTRWMARGLDFWWYDTNWKFSIPPPFSNKDTADQWLGLWSQDWGSHVYHKTTEVFDRTVRDRNGDGWYGGRPIALSMQSVPCARAGMDPSIHSMTPAHHRYPVWWTGDFVTLQASVETMVDAGVYHLKPYVHSDCGGDYLGTGGNLLRWTTHCVFGTILRFHGDNHVAWQYGDHVTDVVRMYLNIRQRLSPSLIAAGQRATRTGFPLVARCDLYWPEQGDYSRSNHQYIFLEDVLVAPIMDVSTNVTTRSVWIPPGEWQDAWDGSITAGPATLLATQPYERQPMWIRRDNALMILAGGAALRIGDQNWTELTVEAFPATTGKPAAVTRRALYDRGTAARTDVTLWSGGSGYARLDISEATDRASRTWVLRFHLRVGERLGAAKVDGESMSVADVHIEPFAVSGGGAFVPFAGAGAAPAPKAGAIAELRLPCSPSFHSVEIWVTDGTIPPIITNPMLPAPLTSVAVVLAVLTVLGLAMVMQPGPCGQAAWRKDGRAAADSEDDEELHDWHEALLKATRGDS